MKSLLLVLPHFASTTNPIDQVLDLLQKLRDTVVADGEVEHQEFEKFSEWCEKAATRGQQHYVQTATHAYSKDLLQSCEQRTVEFGIRKRSREEEVKALEYANEILRDKTGPAAKRQYSLLRVEAGLPHAAIDQVVQTIESLGRRNHSSLLLKLASQIRAARPNGRNSNKEIERMIEEKIRKLLAKNEEEATRRSFCDQEMDTTKDTLKRLRGEKTTLSTQIKRATADVKFLKQTVLELQEAVAHTEKEELESDRLRAQQHEEFVRAKADFEQGLVGVHTALHVLHNYYEKSGSAWIIDILKIAQQDFARSLEEGQVTEDHRVSSYNRRRQNNLKSLKTRREKVEQMMQESTRLEHMITEARKALSSAEEEQVTVRQYLEKLRPECDTKPDKYNRRKRRREKDIENLERALQALEDRGALVQKRRPQFRSRKHVAIQ